VDGIQTCIYQMTMRHKRFPDPLNAVIISKINLQTQARAHVLLFSSDLDLAYDKLIDYYRLRFQIEFNFQDAKQFWGLEDFMNVNQTLVYNAANLALFARSLSSDLSNLQCQRPQSLLPRAEVRDRNIKITSAKA
jgi:putative transposase